MCLLIITFIWPLNDLCMTFKGQMAKIIHFLLSPISNTPIPCKKADLTLWCPTAHFSAVLAPIWRLFGTHLNQGYPLYIPSKYLRYSWAFSWRKPCFNILRHSKVMAGKGLLEINMCCLLKYLIFLTESLKNLRKCSKMQEKCVKWLKIIHVLFLP